MSLRQADLFVGMVVLETETEYADVVEVMGQEFVVGPSPARSTLTGEWFSILMAVKEIEPWRLCSLRES